MRIAGLALLIAVCALPGSARKRKLGMPMAKLPQQNIALPEFTPVIAAQKCENYAWAAGLETLLRAQNVVTLDQHYWVTKLWGGELCEPDFGKFEDLAKAIDGEYVRDDGSKVRVKTTYVAGVPQAVDSLIADLRRGRATLFFWKGHPYLLAGMVYDEYVAPNGQRLYDIQQMKLRDPYYAQGEQLFATWAKDTDSLADINGTMQVTVTTIEQQPWIR